MGRTFTVSAMTKHPSLLIGAARSSVCQLPGVWGIPWPGLPSSAAVYPTCRLFRTRTGLPLLRSFGSCTFDKRVRSAIRAIESDPPSTPLAFPSAGSCPLDSFFGILRRASVGIGLAGSACDGDVYRPRSRFDESSNPNAWVLDHDVRRAVVVAVSFSRSTQSCFLHASGNLRCISRFLFSSLSLVGPSAWFVGRWWCAGRAFGPSSRWFRR